ncbi:hypothetical protein HUT06_41635 [Actinomadura sp. NAK00032]|uniref:hypothetical protein n=1 Tax=Actinomadura sp. NAK00032 TaxID=2742128 RepID=UPI00159208E3|nr:hypothetical protein [Actinomadura sp. NAK00032]QKW39733.1 hypothetical protein HUT06_41635 [Actinomadura sp. NAK00032]
MDGGPGRGLRASADAGGRLVQRDGTGPVHRLDQYARCWGIRALAGNVSKVVFAVIDRT